MFKRIAVVAVIAGAGYFYWHKHDAPVFDPSKISSMPAASSSTLSAAEDAFRQHRSGVELTVEGTVDKILPDDTEGSPHQRFILRLASGQTVLIAHNIELASRIKGLAPGTPVQAHGEYEWNDKGGVVHWTHEDPKGTHQPGWIEVGGKRYD
ncbi:MAG TPA: DUF3465 domain-containing protein [Steroidobacteraceae bacterium]|nr:DUF3465 domain-containing protein [Steroidobacteraceae bacterium]